MSIQEWAIIGNLLISSVFIIIKIIGIFFEIRIDCEKVGWRIAAVKILMK